MIATENDISLLRQIAQEMRCKIELLDDRFNAVEELDGYAYSVSANIDASSDMRRTATFSLVPKEELFSVENFAAEWLDRIVRLSIGLKRGGGFIYHVIGSYLLTQNNFLYDAVNNALTLTLVDLMAYGTSERGGQIGLGVKIPFGSNVEGALTAMLGQYMPLKFSDISAFPDVIPYDLEFASGTYPAEILKKIISLFPTYEQYYDADGVYHAHAIPTHVDEDVLLDESVLDDLIISEKLMDNLTTIKNTTEIWGRVLPADYVATRCVLDGDVYALEFLTEMKTIETNATYCLVPEVISPANPKMKIPLVDNLDGEADTLDVIDGNGNALLEGAMVANVPYVLKCVASETNGVVTKRFVFQGQKTIHVIVREVNEMPNESAIAEDKAVNDCNDVFYVVNPESKFACDRGGRSIARGEIRQVFSGGEYAGIYTTGLAYERGKYENYLRTRMNTDVELKTMLIPFIDVNKKIQYTSPTTGKIHQYLVKSVSMDVTGFTMTMKLARFYNYYPF